MDQSSWEKGRGCVGHVLAGHPVFGRGLSVLHASVDGNTGRERRHWLGPVWSELVARVCAWTEYSDPAGRLEYRLARVPEGTATVTKSL